MTSPMRRAALVAIATLIAASLPAKAQYIIPPEQFDSDDGEPDEGNPPTPQLSEQDMILAGWLIFGGGPSWIRTLAHSYPLGKQPVSEWPSSTLVCSTNSIWGGLTWNCN
jgi:hypothetical protein